MDLGGQRHEPTRDVLDAEERRPLEVVSVEQALISSPGAADGLGLFGAEALCADREPAGDDATDDHADKAEDGRHDHQDDRYPRVGHGASSHAPGSARSALRPRRTARSERDTVPRGPVAQRQSTGLLIPWSWVRIPPGSQPAWCACSAGQVSEAPIRRLDTNEEGRTLASDPRSVARMI